MHAFAHPYVPWALPGIIVASALGALVMCLLVLACGFPTGEARPEAPGEPSRRLLLTRLGHALAATCFAIVAMLAVVALSRPFRAALPPPEAGPGRAEVETLRRQVAALRARLNRAEGRLSATQSRADASATRMDRVETRLGAAEAGLQHVSAEAGRALAAITQRTVRPTPALAPRRPASPNLAPAPSASSATEAGPRASGSTRRRSNPPAPEEAALPVAPSQAPDPSSEAARVQAEAQEQQPDLSDKLRGDWEAIKRDNRAAGDEIRKAFRDLWENVSR
jgi:hypothetical protein